MKKVFVIEFQDLSDAYYNGRHEHIEVVRDNLEEAIDEIEFAKETDTNFIDTSKIVFDGPVEEFNRKYLFTWEKTDKKGVEHQCSYIVREIELSPDVQEAIDRYDYNALLESRMERAGW